MLWVWEKRPPAAMLKALKSQTRLELGPAQSPNLERLLARQFRFHPLGNAYTIEIFEWSGVGEGAGGRVLKEPFKRVVVIGIQSQDQGRLA